jgi:biopolymer transport protein ExbD
MDPSRLRALIAPAMASLFLVLSLCAFVAQRPPSVGMRLQMPRVQRHADWRECEDDMPIFVIIHKNGDVFIRQTQENPSDLVLTIANIMANRESERAVYVIPDSDVPFSLVAGIYDKIASSATTLDAPFHVFLVTERIKRYAESYDVHEMLWGICDFEWPENGYKAESWYATPTAPRDY